MHYTMGQTMCRINTAEKVREDTVMLGPKRNGVLTSLWVLPTMNQQPSSLYLDPETYAQWPAGSKCQADPGSLSIARGAWHLFSLDSRLMTGQDLLS